VSPKLPAAIKDPCYRDWHHACVVRLLQCADLIGPSRPFTSGNLYAQSKASYCNPRHVLVSAVVDLVATRVDRGDLSLGSSLIHGRKPAGPARLQSEIGTLSIHDKIVACWFPLPCHPLAVMLRVFKIFIAHGTIVSTIASKPHSLHVAHNIRTSSCYTKLRICVNFSHCRLVYQQVSPIQVSTVAPDFRLPLKSCVPYPSRSGEERIPSHCHSSPQYVWRLWELAAYTASPSTQKSSCPSNDSTSEGFTPHSRIIPFTYVWFVSHLIVMTYPAHSTHDRCFLYTQAVAVLATAASLPSIPLISRPMLSSPATVVNSLW
jgi:hypothetical protein